MKLVDERSDDGFIFYFGIQEYRCNALTAGLSCLKIGRRLASDCSVGGLRLCVGDGYALMSSVLSLFSGMECFVVDRSDYCSTKSMWTSLEGQAL